MPEVWPEGTLLVSVPEPGDADWPGEWVVYLQRTADERVEVRRWGEDKGGAIAQMSPIAELLYPRGTKQARGPAAAVYGRRI